MKLLLTMITLLMASSVFATNYTCYVNHHGGINVTSNSKSTMFQLPTNRVFISINSINEDGAPQMQKEQEVVVQFTQNDVSSAPRALDEGIILRTLIDQAQFSAFYRIGDSAVAISCWIK